MVDLNRIRDQLRKGQGVHPVPPSDAQPSSDSDRVVQSARHSRAPSSASGGGLAATIVVVILIGIVWFLIGSRNQVQQQPHPLPPFAVTRMAIGTGIEGGSLSGAQTGNYPSFESPNQIVLFAAFENAHPETDRVAMRLQSDASVASACENMSISTTSGFVSCAINGVAAGDYHFEFLLNGRSLGSRPFRVTDHERLQRMLSFAQVASWVNGGRPAGDASNVLPGPNSPAGLYLEYVDAKSEDVISVRLFQNGAQLDACPDYVVQSIPEGIYRCQLSSMVTGAYEFQVVINGDQVRSLPFSVSDPPIAAPFNVAPSYYTGAFPIENPEWLDAPDPRRIARRFPDRALDRGQDGRVVLTCIARFDGTLACNVDSEEPRGWGFGTAALRAAEDFRLRPYLRDGRPVTGGQLRIPLAWHVE